MSRVQNCFPDTGARTGDASAQFLPGSVERVEESVAGNDGERFLRGLRGRVRGDKVGDSASEDVLRRLSTTVVRTVQHAASENSHRGAPGGAAESRPAIGSYGIARCSRHAEEREKLYCFDCVENICLMCFAVQHQQHKCQEIDTAAESFKSRLAADTNKISDQISLVRQLLSKTEVMREAFLNEVENLHADIQKRGEYIKQIVDSCIKAVLQKLELLKTDTEKIIACDEDKLQLSLAALESFNAYSLELQNKGKPEDVSRSASDLFRRAKELLQDSAQMSTNRTPVITLTSPDCEIEDSVAKYVGSLTSDRMTGAIF